MSQFVSALRDPTGETGSSENMSEIRYSHLGETWLALLRRVCEAGEPVGGETRELLNVAVAFEKGGFREPRLAPLAAGQSVEEMRKVFFSTLPNQFGHSYADKLRGPLGRSDLSDVVELLAEQPWSKRALVSLTGEGDGKVPCINVIHFLRREQGLLVTYFSRGQDIFRKFYADGQCVCEMANRVASQLDAAVALIRGVISSAHVYLDDLAEARALLADAEAVNEQKAGLHEELA